MDEVWTEAKLERLRELWQAGRSIVDIARDLGVSRGAVVGKRRRLDLSPRLSPIVRATGAKPRPRRAGAVTLPPLASLRGV